ncbi:glycoside hydrolase family 26 protein [Flavobacterium nackdongense]|uniref:Mannan endo-1,4-beta-mannosidase n=1 Tax=Flavobacterium nackdongense TaxID=2547394 RepID=A0A4P6Y981_9FLAO|nr:glycosyl hydrolase [Flavobacterium nackdongense]QBN19499.1 endoglucanase [Flavobacterium nackdongense]
MNYFKKQILQITFSFLLSINFLVAQKSAEQPLTMVDQKATKATKAVFSNMFSASKKGIMLGHQDDAAYGREWYNLPGRSDVKETAGDYPAVVGWELADVELGAQRNIDSVYFSNMKNLIRQVHERGSINTISWHANNIVTGKSAWDCKQDSVVRSILKGGSNHERFLKYLDKVADFFQDLKDKNGEPIPVIFRMFHEHTGAWFWWGAKQCTPDEYIALYQMTVGYLRDVKQVHNLIYAFSPAEITSEAQFLSRFPGKEWVDIVGFDTYCPDSTAKVVWYKETVTTGLKVITKYASDNQKIAILAETGQEGIQVKNYFTEILLPLIKDYNLSYVLLWRNAFNIKKHYYIPYPNHPEASDFIRFTKDKHILLSQEAAKLELYKNQ